MPDGSTTPAVHDPYFTALSTALHRAGLAAPVLVIDRQRLDANIDAVVATLGGRMPVRLVVKSLPCADLLRHIASRLGSDRYMVFNRPMLSEMARLAPNADLLLGKPLPVTAVSAYYDAAGNDGPGPQWLVDTPERLAQYTALARARALTLRVNIEIDVGLHRGGLSDPRQLAALLDGLDPAIQITGLMGYDPHIAKTPTALGLRARVNAAARRTYRAMADILRDRLGGQGLVLNTAGSPTYALHAKDSPGNEVAIGSAFVKPTDFDIATLAHHVPACFIATPLLKVAHPALLPGLDGLSPLLARLRPATAQAQFIHGGHWLADPISPPGLVPSSLFGPSSNQECWLGPHRPNFRPDDWIFLRPRQSEALFLQFGPLVVFDGTDITQAWPVFPVSA